jgi:phosphoenolpyruvate carboxykinase (ATP)
MLRMVRLVRESAMNALSPIHSLNEGRDGLIRSQLAKLGLSWLGSVSWNETAPVLMKKSLARGEAALSATGALLVETGQHTGRSPNDKYIVRDPSIDDHIWWKNNKAMERQHFEQLQADMFAYAQLKDAFVQDLLACPGLSAPLCVRVVTEQAWSSLFMRHLLKPAEFEPNVETLTIICLPSFKAQPARHGTSSETVIALDLAKRLVLIAGTAYAGEMKKAVFTFANFMLPAQGVLPMHCSANIGAQGDTALFFGLSGTGKTTLSADPTRALIGDDEHGWGPQGVFNIENGCYAKVINLEEVSEPQIFKAVQGLGAVLENVVFDEGTGRVDFNDKRLTENTRGAYPLDAIANARPGIVGAHPKTIIMLTADAFGVLPPVARLSPAQAMQQFLIGYTAKLAGTERGVTTPQATFSACFGAPFLPRPPETYAALLRKLVQQHGTQCYLLNTGWTGGAYGTGKRMSLGVTRAILKAVLAGDVSEAPCRKDENFGFDVPLTIEGVDAKLLDPRQSWSDGASYDAAALDLRAKFAAALNKMEGPE